MHGLLANYSPDMRSWKTCQGSLLEDSETFSETWPRSGMTRNGIAYQLPTLAPLIVETECGLLPTPGANDWKGSSKVGQRDGQLDEWAENLPTWIPCPCCEEFMCTTHWPSHAHECDCPALEEMEETFGMEPYSEAMPGRLSPELSEWMLGFPEGWTELDASETPSSRKSRKQSGGQS